MENVGDDASETLRTDHLRANSAQIQQRGNQMAWIIWLGFWIEVFGFWFLVALALGIIWGKALKKM